VNLLKTDLLANAPPRKGLAASRQYNMLAGAGSTPAIVKNVKFKMLNYPQRQPTEKIFGLGS
jgi:hypothetical protein